MKDHGFCGHLLQRHKAVELEQERSKSTIIGLYLSGLIEQARSERTVIGVYMSGLIEQENQHWCLYERVDRDESVGSL
jgi:predicted Zn-dependent protease